MREINDPLASSIDSNQRVTVSDFLRHHQSLLLCEILLDVNLPSGLKIRQIVSIERDTLEPGVGLALQRPGGRRRDEGLATCA